MVQVKSPLAMQETWVWFLDQEDTLEKGMATHSSILAWRISRQKDLEGYSPLQVAKSRTRVSKSLLILWNGLGSQAEKTCLTWPDGLREPYPICFEL